ASPLVVRRFCPIRWKRRGSDRVRCSGRARRLWIAVRGADCPPDRRARARPGDYREVGGMEISNVVEKLGRAIFEAPFGGGRVSKDSPELAEIRLAVLDAAKSKGHRAGGKSVFAFNIVRIHLRGVPQEQSALWQGEFLSKYFLDELRAGLARANYRFPEDREGQIHTSTELPEA